MDLHYEDLADDIYYEQASMEEESDGTPISRFIVNNLIVRIPELNFSLREGSCEMWDANENEFYADWSLSLLYCNDGADASSYDYFEQDDYATTLYNYMTFCGLSFSNDMMCQIVLLN